MTRSMDLAFLTGGTGFVGASLARLLLKQGLRVKALAKDIWANVSGRHNLWLM